MTKSPFFSVIIPTFNRCDLLPQTLDTILCQSFEDYEIIVVDNGSTDQTHQLFSSTYFLPQIKYYRSEQNHERAWARNFGMTKCSGVYATFLDSDDFLYPTALEDAYSFFLSNRKIHIFHNLYELVNDNLDTVYRYRFPSLRNQHKALASGNFLSCIGVYIHRQIYRKYRFTTDPRMTGSEDYDFWLRILSTNKLGRINKVNSGIRQHHGRSVNNSVYDLLGYQCSQITITIQSDEVLASCYSSFIPRLEASFFLMRAIATNQKICFWVPLQLLCRALVREPSILLTVRPYQVLYNILKHQPTRLLSFLQSSFPQ